MASNSSSKPEHPPRPTGANAIPIGVLRNHGKGVVDPIAQGFDMIMDRFDKLEFRLDRTDRRVDDLEVHEELNEGEFEEHGDHFHRDNDTGVRYSIAGLRNRWGNGRGKRGDYCAVGGYRGRGGRHQHRRGGPDLQNRDNHRHRTTWDPPLRNHDDWDDDDNWNPSHRRGRYNGQHHDHPTGVQMRPPHFDGSDAPNWISRVQYYFDHVRVPEDDRLHYVVMLLEPPASEWIFNYRTNNPWVSWPDFLEDVRQRFDP